MDGPNWKRDGDDVQFKMAADVYKIKEGRMAAGVYNIKKDVSKMAADVYNIKKDGGRRV